MEISSKGHFIRCFAYDGTECYVSPYGKNVYTVPNRKAQIDIENTKSILEAFEAISRADMTIGSDHSVSGKNQKLNSDTAEVVEITINTNTVQFSVLGIKEEAQTHGLAKLNIMEIEALGLMKLYLKAKLADERVQSQD